MTKFPLIILFLILLCSCFSTRNLTDKVYYNLKEASVRLIMHTGKDTILTTTYESTHGLPGSACNLFTVTHSLDTVSRLGIAIRLWADIVVPPKSIFYGHYPKLGLLEKIQSLKVALETGHTEYDITQLIMGDSLISTFYWRDAGVSPVGQSYYIERNCYQLPFFERMTDLITTLNHHANTLKGIEHYDFVFWLDKKHLSAIDFKPDYLSMTMTLTDSTGTKSRSVVDKWKIEGK